MKLSRRVRKRKHAINEEFSRVEHDPGISRGQSGSRIQPAKRTEPGKTRPVLISSKIRPFWMRPSIDDHHPPDNESHRTRRALRIRVKARENAARDSDLLIDQIRAIRQSTNHLRSHRQSGTRTDEEVYQAVLEVIGMNLSPRMSESPHTVKRCAV